MEGAQKNDCRQGSAVRRKAFRSFASGVLLFRSGSTAPYGADGGSQHIHRCASSGGSACRMAITCLGSGSYFASLPLQCRQLGSVRQLAFPQQIRGFFEGGVLHQVRLFRSRDTPTARPRRP